MSKEKILNIETLVSAIKEVAAAISENGGAEIKARVKEINEGEMVAHIIIEPYCFVSREEYYEKLKTIMEQGDTKQ